MAAILSVLVVVALSILVTRVASIALQLSGLSRETARFQARSAFTGVGFTTAESESVTLHPDRRRIVLLLMLLGSAGLASGIAGLMLSFVDTSTTQIAIVRGLVLVGGLLALTALARSSWLERHLARLIEKILRRFTALDTPKAATLLDLDERYNVARFEIDSSSWLAGQTLADASLDDEGVLVLGIVRSDGSYVGSPRGRYTLHPGDTLVLYGPSERLGELRGRLTGTSGERAHAGARSAHDDTMREQDAEQHRYATQQGEREDNHEREQAAAERDEG